MRRSDREITDISEIMEIVGKCGVCRLGLARNNIPYVVPMNYGYEYAGGKLTLYFHGAKTGKKHDIIAENPAACFEMDCSHELTGGAAACDYGMDYESVVGTGKITVCDERDEKVKALALLMKNYAPDGEFTFPDAAVDAVTVFKIEADEFSGKRRKKS